MRNISIIATDKDGETAQKDLQVTVKSVNTAPVAKDISVTTDFGESITVDVLSSSTDADGDVLSIK
ncbi:MAG: hypothetical protein GY827_03350 [Cytophagales bacterium]|nr:hypothetical protein [Cytophagales bacterium]